MRTERSQPLRVCYFGTYRADYSRNRTLIDGLASAGVEVVECHEQLWHSIEDRVDVASGGWRRPAFWWRMLRVYARLLRRYGTVGRYDVLVTGYPGHFDVFLARLLAALAGVPLAWDVFMSLYQAGLERKLDRRSRLSIRLIWAIEWAACRLPDQLIIETEENAAYFRDTYGVPIERFRLVPTGAYSRVFTPGAPAGDRGADEIKVLYWGSYVANHGAEYIIEAARLLAQDDRITFEMVGTGPERPHCETLAGQYGLCNIVFTNWLEKTELVERIHTADICLGTFGSTPNALVTVQNKVYEGLAAARPMISGDSPSVRKALRHGEHIFLCERANPAALAAAIQTLQRDPDLRARIAAQGHAYYLEHYTVERLGARFREHLERLVAG